MSVIRPTKRLFMNNVSAPAQFPTIGSHPFGEEDVRALVSSIARDGFARIHGYFGIQDIAEARAQVIEKVRRSNGEYTSMGGTQGLKGHILFHHFASDDALNLCRAVCRHQGHDLPADVGHKQVLRCLSGESGLRHSYYFHFDSYFLTILVPIEIPAGEEAGDLLLFPNLRSHRKSYLVNAFEKFFYERKIVQRLIRFIALRSSRVVRLKMEPGSVYLFNGDRTLHANASCDRERLRATLLFHYGETYRYHWLKRTRRAWAPALG